MTGIKLALGAEVDIATGDEVRDAVKGSTDTILNRIGRSAVRGNRRRIPASYSLTAAATGSFVLDFGSPSGNTLWWLVEAVITGVDDRTGTPATVVNQASAVFAAAAAGSVALPVLGESITGYIINLQSPAAAVVMDVTVTNVAGGTITNRISVPVGGKDVAVTFPAPIPALNAGVAPTVTVPATVGGPAYSITVTGQTVTAPPVAAMYCGAPSRQQTPTSVIDTPSLGTLVRPGVALPAVFQFPKEVWPVHNGENLFAVVYSTLAPLTVVSGVATVIEIDSSLVTLDRM